MERIGLRSISLPFDWLIISDFQVVLRLIESHFEHFLIEDDLIQEVEVKPKYYYDTYNKIHHYHDFNAWDKISDQLPSVKQKYLRRIERFYCIIKDPCLFIRYCDNIDEYRMVCENLENIRQFFKKYNSKSDLVFVCNEYKDTNLDNRRCFYYVTPDENDVVNRQFLKSSKSLYRYIIHSVDITKRERFHNKVRYFRTKIEKKIKSKFSSGKKY